MFHVKHGGEKMNYRIKKTNIKEYIEDIENELEKVSKKIRRINKMQLKFRNTFYADELKELYLKQQFYEGQLSASIHILNNC